MWCEHMCKVHEKTPVRGVLFTDHHTRRSSRVHHQWFLQSSHQFFAWVPTRLVRARQPHPVIGLRKLITDRKEGARLATAPPARLPSPQGSALPSCSAAGCGSLSRSRPQSGLTPACASSSFGGAWAGAELVLLLGQPAWVSLGQDHALPRSPSRTSSCSRSEKSPSFSASLCSSPSCINRPPEVWTSSLDSLIAGTKLSGGGAASGLHTTSMIPAQCSKVLTTNVSIRQA